MLCREVVLVGSRLARGINDIAAYKYKPLLGSWLIVVGRMSLSGVKRKIKGKAAAVPATTYKKQATLVKVSNSNLLPSPPPAPIIRANAASNYPLGSMNGPVPLVEEVAGYSSDMAQKIAQHEDEQLADGEEVTTAHLKEQMDRLKSMNQNKKINVEDSVGPDAIRSEVTVGDLLVLKMFHQSSLLNGICIYVKKISKGDKDEQCTTILEDPMIFAADDVPFMIGAFEKMLARKRLWRQAKAAG